MAGGGGKMLISESTRKKMSEWQIGRELTEISKIKVARTHMGGKTIVCSNGKTYLSVLEAAKDINTTQNAINHALMGNVKKTSDLFFWFIYADGANDKDKVMARDLNRKKLPKFDEQRRITHAVSMMKGKKIGCSNGKTYISLLEASQDANIATQKVAHALTGKQKQAGSLLFWYIFPDGTTEEGKIRENNNKPRPQFSEERKINNARKYTAGNIITCSNGKIYLSLYEASLDTGIKRENIFLSIKKDRKTFGLQFWRIPTIV